VSQLRRASVAVVSNIAEGVGRSTQRDFARLIAMASGSAAEVSTQLQLVQRLHGLDCDAAQQQVRAVSKMLRSFHARLSSDLDPSS
jgi:four helix bundle protein